MAHKEIPHSYFWVAEMFPEPEEYDDDESSYWEYFDPSEMVEEDY